MSVQIVLDANPGCLRPTIIYSSIIEGLLKDADFSDPDIQKTLTEWKARTHDTAFCGEFTWNIPCSLDTKKLDKIKTKIFNDIVELNSNGVIRYGGVV